MNVRLGRTLLALIATITLFASVVPAEAQVVVRHRHHHRSHHRHHRRPYRR